MNGQDVLHLVTCGNSAYALGASVTVRSAAEHLRPGVRLVVHFLDTGITDADWERMRASWAGLPIEAVRYFPDEALLRTLPLDDPARWGLYARLTMPDLLPAEVDRVIYLDGDVLVLKDLTPLRDVELGEFAVAAAVEPAVASLTSPLVRLAPPGGVPSEERTWIDPIPNHAALGIAPDARYFNAGVFVTDLRRWRAEGLTERLLACLRVNAAHVRYADQYALNVVFHGRILPLDLRWNRPAALEFFACPEDTGLAPEEFEAARSEPWILHYAGVDKPWLPRSRPTGQARYFEYLARTAWPIPELAALPEPDPPPPPPPPEPPPPEPPPRPGRWRRMTSKLRRFFGKATARLRAVAFGVRNSESVGSARS